MKSLSALPLRYKAFLSGTVIFLLVLSVAAWVWVSSLYASYQDSFEQRINTQAEMLAGSINAAVFFNDRETIEELLDVLERDSAVLSVSVQGLDQHIFMARRFTDNDSHQSFPLLQWLYEVPQYYVFKADVYYEDSVIANLQIEAHAFNVLKATRQAMFQINAAVFAAFLIAALLSALIIDWLLTPMEQLFTLAQTVKNTKNYTLRGDVRSKDEVGRLTEEFNAMLAMIEERDYFLESEVRDRTRDLAYQAMHDELTGLPNRRGLHEFLRRIFDDKPEYASYALLLLDLDQFKVVNDTCGHLAGDGLLKGLAEELEATLRPADFIARLGGDEFAIVLDNVDDSVMAVIAEKVRSNIESYTFSWEGVPLHASVSIGALVFDRFDSDVPALIKQADAACFEAKDLGRNRVYAIRENDQGMDERHNNMLLVQKVLSAISNDAFILYRQQIVALNGSQITQYELLLRLKDPDTGRIIEPDYFLPAVNRYGISGNVDKWVFSTLLEKLKHDQKNAGVRYWVNLSSGSISDVDTVDFLLNSVLKASLPKGTLVFEITETVFISDLSIVAQNMIKLKALGCKFALDDFGSGASSFNYIKRLPIDYIKIDGSFISNLALSEADYMFAKSIVDIAHVMKLETVAEHIENPATLDLVEKLGVDFGQGWAFDRPEVF